MVLASPVLRATRAGWRTFVCRGLAAALLATAGSAAGQSLRPGLFSRAGGPQPDGETCFALGCRELERGEARAAIHLLSRALEYRSADERYACKLAQAWLAAGDGASAERLLRNLAPATANSLDLSYTLARVLAVSQDWKGVERALGECQVGLDTPARLLYFQALLKLGQSEAALQYLKDSVRDLPAEPALSLALIDQLLERGESMAAVAACEALTPAQASTPEACFRFAKAYFQCGRLLGQTRELRFPAAAPGEFHDNWLVVRELGQKGVLLCAPPQSALFRARQALDGGCNDAELVVLYARMWARLGQAGTALEVIAAREQIILSSSSAEVLQAAAEIALAADAVPAYLRYVRKMTQLAPEHADELLFDAYRRAAQHAGISGDADMHVQWLSRALALRPNDERTLLELADSQWEADRKDEARRLYLTLLAAQPVFSDRSRILERLFSESVPVSDDH